MPADHARPELLAFARAMANMVAADGRVTDEERLQLESVLRGMGLDVDEDEVKQLVDAEFRAPGAIAEIAAGVKAKDLRAALLRLLVEMACTDGEIAGAEKAKVVDTARVFGFDAAIVEELIGVVVDGILLEARENSVMQKLVE